MDVLKYADGKKILHLTHSYPDCDAIASVYWGVSTFGGDCYFHMVTSKKSRVFLDYTDLKPLKFVPDPSKYDLVIVYDTERPLEYVDIVGVPYVIFDHHPRETDFVNKAFFSYKIPSSANVVNLYYFSIENELEVVKDEKILFSFAVGLYTDTIALKTARENELYLMGKFLGNKRLEEILNLFSTAEVNSKKFLNHLKTYKEYLINGYKIGLIELDDPEDETHVFIDGLFYPFNLDIAVFVLPNGIKFHVRKRDVQKIYHRVLVSIEKEWKIEKDRGIWKNFFDVKKLLEELALRLPKKI